jgi:hypothetical protein
MRQRTALAMSFLLTGIAVVRIVSTYTEFSQVWDEPAHIACGMEWLERHTYTFEPQHPPLARVTVALGPYLAGLRLRGQGDMWEEGNAILYARDRYPLNLALARLGALPFFVLATAIVWVWSRKLFGDTAATLAVLLFTTQPVVLAHAGLATTDMALTATFLAALLAFTYWMEKPDHRRSLLLGLAAALATLSKFSALVFLPACVLALVVCRWITTKETIRFSRLGIRVLFKPLGIAVISAFIIVWLGYRFSFHSLTTAAERPHRAIDRVLGDHGAPHDLAYYLGELPVPAPELIKGVDAVREHNLGGHRSYLLGDIRQTGWWYFFPVALAVKTPVPFLLLAGIGLVFLVCQAWRDRDWKPIGPAMAAGTILLVSMLSQIDIGVRHILPVYPLLAIVAAAGVISLWNRVRPRLAKALIVLVLVAWQIVASARAHPDYLAYFNELGRDHPERILIGSDLDWGQDLPSLERTLRSLHVDGLALAYYGTADPARSDLPAFSPLTPGRPTRGWVAISVKYLKMGVPEDRYAFAWLERYKPAALAGRSIVIYYVP